MPKQPKLAPSEVLWEQELNQIQAHMQTHQLIFVRGRPGIGKTTLLHQVEKFLAPHNALYIHFRNKVDLSFALNAICDALQTPYPRKGAALHEEISELESFVFEKLRETGRVLLWDNIDNIEGAAEFLDRFLRDQNPGPIIASCTNTPAIDPMRVMDCAFVDLEGFSLAQVKTFLRASPLRYDENDLDKIASTLKDTCESNPTILKLAVAPFVVSRKPLLADQISTSSVAAHEKYFESLLSSLDQDSKRILLSASLIRYTTEIEHRKLEVLKSEVSSRLLEGGVLFTSGDRFTINHVFKKILLENVSAAVSNEERQALVEQLQTSDEYSWKKELVFQLNALTDLQRAGDEFSSFYPKLLEKGDLQSFEELSQPCFVFITPSAFLERRYILADRGALSKAEFEAATYLQKTDLLPRERAFIAGCYLHTLYRMGKIVEAKQLSVDTLELAKEFPLTYARILVTIAMIEMTEKRSESARDICDKIDISKLPQPAGAGPDAHQYSETLQGLAFVYESAGDLVRALDAYTVSAAFSRDRFGTSFTFFAELNVSNTLYRMGRVAEAMAALNNLRTTAAGLPLSDQEYWKYDRALHLMNQGKYSEALLELSIGNTYLCQSYSKNIALHCLNLLRLNRHNELRAFDIGEFSNVFNEAESRFIYYIRQLIDLEHIHVNLLMEFDRKTSLRVSLSNLFLEQAWKRCSVLKEDQLQTFLSKDTGTELVDFFLKVERLVLINLHLLSMGRENEANKGLMECLEMLDGTEFNVWKARVYYGLTCINLRKGNIEAAGDHFDKFRLLKAHCDMTEDLGDDVLADYIRLGRTTAEISSAIQTHERLAIIFHNSKVIKTGKFILRTKRGTYEVETDSLGDNSAITLDLVRNCLKLSTEEVDLSQRPIIRGLLELFLRSPNRIFSKEELIERIWMESYNPLHHDSRIYTNLKRLRELLSKSKIESKIESTDKGYVFKSNEEFSILEPASDVAKMNERQRWIITYLEKNPHLTRSNVEKALGISTSLAGNDLKELLDQGWLEKQGQGKSTVYLRKA